MKQPYDVLIAGAGNAGLCAAISAAEEGAKVVVLEKSPKKYRGGNSSLTMNLRFSYESLLELEQLLADQTDDQRYGELVENFYKYPVFHMVDDLLRTSNYRADRELIEMVAKNSLKDIQWLYERSLRWEVKPNIMDHSVPIRVRGGGPELQKINFDRAEKLGVDILYETPIKSLKNIDRGWRVSSQSICIDAKTVIFACGGYQGNVRMRCHYLGSQWKHTALRGVRYNTGDGIRLAEQVGGILRGDFKNAHATPQSSMAKDYLLPGQQAESQKSSRYAFNCGILVGNDGRRFLDEGSDMPNFLYAEIGGKLKLLPGQTAFQIIDAKTRACISAGYWQTPYYTEASVEKLEETLAFPKGSLKKTIDGYNQACPQKPINLRYMDGVKAYPRGQPTRSNWALKLDRGPFYAFPIQCGLTFTYGGIGINLRAEVLSKDTNEKIPGLFACGETVGGIFYGNYAGGSGMMAGTVFGRIAGRQAAVCSKEN